MEPIGTQDEAGGPGVRLVADAYSQDARAYEATWAPAIRPYGRRLITSLPLSDARRVLDAGAGVGSLLADIQSAAPRAAVVAVDASSGMLARAPSRFPRAVMDLACLGIAPESFDAVVLAFVLFHVHRPDAALRELHRVLRPGGALGTITWDAEPRFAAHRIVSEELDRQGAPPEAGAFVDHVPFSDPDRMRARLSAAGFDVLRAWTAPFAHPYPKDEFLDIRIARGSVRRRLASLDPAQREAFLSAARRRLDPLPPDDFVDRATLVYATASRG